MNKISKFLVLNNPLIKSGDYILHTRIPHILIEVLEFENEEEQISFINERQNESGFSCITARTITHEKYYALIVNDVYDVIKNTQEAIDEITKICMRAADWYKAALQKKIQ